MKCIDFERYMSEYYDEMLDESFRLEFEEHLNLCDECRVKYQNMVNILDEIKSINEIEVPDGFHEELMEKLAQEDKKSKKILNIDFKWMRNKNSYQKGALIAASLFVVFASGKFLNENMISDKAVEEYSPKMEMATEMSVQSEAPMLAGQRDAKVSNEQSLAIAPNRALDESKIIKSGYINITVNDIEKSFNSVLLRTKEFAGFVEYSNLLTERESANLSVRVPRERFEDYIMVIEKLGLVEEKNISEVNVTQNYIDMDSKLNNLKAQEERIRQILLKAEKIQEVIEVERELSRVRSEIESLTRNLNSIDNQVSYSSLNINLSVDRNQFLDQFREEIKYSFNNAIRNLIGLIRYIPYALIAWLGYAIYKKKNR